MEIIQVEQLVKRYKTLTAVDNVSFTVQEGQCFGLLGPNGAGKTTTIEIMEGIISATEGQVSFFGEPANSAMAKHIGIQFQHTALQDYLTVTETINLFSSFYDHPVALEKLVNLCGLAEFVGQDNRLLSGGQRQRLLLALALVNDPSIVFLDEPTTGLDPQARRQFWQLIKNIKAQGKTIVLTTHYMDEAEQLCDEIVIMDKGKIVEQGAPISLLQKHFKEVFIYLPIANVDEQLIAQQCWNTKDQQVEITTENVEQTISQLIALKIGLDGLHIKSANLDDLFLKLTGHTLAN